jgi:hypothetical protein
MAAPGRLISFGMANRWAFESLGRVLPLDVEARGTTVMAYADAFGGSALIGWAVLVGSAAALTSRPCGCCTESDAPARTPAQSGHGASTGGGESLDADVGGARSGFHGEFGGGFRKGGRSADVGEPT